MGPEDDGEGALGRRVGVPCALAAGLSWTMSTERRRENWVAGGGGGASSPISKPPPHHHGLPTPPPYYAWGGGLTGRRRGWGCYLKMMTMMIILNTHGKIVFHPSA